MTMKGQPDIIVTVRFYTAEEGGRKGPTPPDLFGCPFEFEGKLFDCRLLLNEVGALAPGATAKVPVAFLCPELIKPRLKVGTRFTLWELGTIAEGVVEQIVPA
jgi:hypothetical protein